jgi:hypothetical protein
MAEQSSSKALVGVRVPPGILSTRRESAMEVKVEAYGTQLGKDNTITEALIDGKWGVRFSFQSGHESRYDVVLTVEDAKALVEKIQASIESIAKVKLAQNPKLARILGEINDNNLHGEVNADAPVGKEML